MIVAHPPERGRGRPIVVAGTCGATTCTSTSSTGHTAGGLVGAMVGGYRAVQTARANSPSEARAARVGVIVYFVTLVGVAVAVVTVADVWVVVLGLPVLQLVAAPVAALLAWLTAPAPRAAAINAVARVTGWTFPGALAGGVLTVIGLVALMGLGAR